MITLNDAMTLASIIDDTVHNREVARLIDGEVFRGMARSVCDSDGCFFPRDKDVRDAYIRVTLGASSGLATDVFWPIRELMAERTEYTYMASI